MSQLKHLLEKATQKNEMKWRVYAYDPVKDNKLVHTSELFDDINGAGIEKAEWLKKHPEHTIEIIAESAQKNEGKKVRDINEVPENTAVATAWNNGDGTYKIVVFANKKGKLSDNDTDKFLDKKLFKSHKAAVNYALSKGYYVQSFESADIDVKNPGVLEVPEGKKVDELPQSHFEKLVDKKGYAEVIRALTNLEVWNKDKNKSLSSWASNMADKLKKKFRPESAQINEDKQSEELDELIYHINDRILQLDTVHKMRHDDLAKAINANDLSKIKSILANCRSYIIAKDIVDSFDRAKKLANTMKEFSLESAQMNETRGYTVTVELGVPDNMNNRDIEDEVERLLRTSNKINVVMDVTAERK